MGSRLTIGALGRKAEKGQTFSSANGKVADEADNPLSDAFPWSERERPFRAASGTTEFATAAHLADVDPGSDAQYLP
jgi:hypothetical protein